jgi:hypothetical protein
MTRRRLVLAALAVPALGAAWWWSATGLSAEERRLVGTWSGSPNLVLRFDPDRTLVWTVINIDGTTEATNSLGHWQLGNGVLVADKTNSRTTRVLRPFARRFELAAADLEVRVEMATEDEMTTGWPNGATQTWTRVPAE